LEKAEFYLKQEIDQHQATMRRKAAQLWQQTQLSKANQKRAEISSNVKLRKAMVEKNNNQRSFQLKCDNEESVLLRKV
jgi:hypothetical protein